MKNCTLPLCRDSRGRISFTETGERRLDYRPWLNFLSVFSSDRNLWRNISLNLVVGESVNDIGDVAAVITVLAIYSSSAF